MRDLLSPMYVEHVSSIKKKGSFSEVVRVPHAFELIKKAVVSRHRLLKHLREEGFKHDLSSMQNALKFTRSLNTILSLTAEQKLVLAKRLHKHCYRSDCSSFLTDPSRHPFVVSVIMGVV